VSFIPVISYQDFGYYKAVGFYASHNIKMEEGKLDA